MSGAVAASSLPDGESSNRVETSDGDGRRRGRPRQPELDTAVVKAAVEELADYGYRQTTIEGIARRSGVAKTTLYRRWSSKVDLVIDAMDLLFVRHSAPARSGDIRKDLTSLLEATYAVFEGPYGPAMVSVIMESVHNEDLAGAMRSKIWEPAHRIILEVLRRGVRAGQLRPDIDLELTAAILSAVPSYYTLPGGVRMKHGLARHVVDTVLDGVAA